MPLGVGDAALQQLLKARGVVHTPAAEAKLRRGKEKVKKDKGTG